MGEMVAIKSSLVILKEAKEELQSELTTLERTDAHKSAQHLTKLKRQISSVESSIEILEAYEIDEQSV
jgi:hypothetical protein